MDRAKAIDWVSRVAATPAADSFVLAWVESDHFAAYLPLLRPVPALPGWRVTTVDLAHCPPTFWGPDDLLAYAEGTVETLDRLAADRQAGEYEASVYGGPDEDLPL